jgi:AcrR family transcriptional regulator
VNEIVALAGTSRATFYLHFRQKMDIAAALHDEMWNHARDFFFHLGELPHWSTELIGQWIAAEVVTWEDRRRTAMTLEGLNLGLGVEQVRAECAVIAAAMVDRGGLWTTIPHDHARLRARTVVDVLVHYNHHWLNRGFEAGRDTEVGFLSEVVRAALTVELGSEDASSDRSCPSVTGDQ